MTSTDQMILDVIIPAAGKGLRLGGTIPKQYLNVNGQPLLTHTLERLQRIRPRRVILVVSEDDNYWRDVPGTEDCEIVFGGDTRASSVLNGLLALDSGTSLDESDWVLVHDAARPCVKEMDITRLISAVGQHEVGGILGVQIIETVKYVAGQTAELVNDGEPVQGKAKGSRGAIHETLDRDNLWLAQTPQLFRRTLLKRALTQALLEIPERGVTANRSTRLVTDESSALEKMGYSPLIVEGSRDNIKVTNAEDLELAAFFLRKQSVLEKRMASAKIEFSPDHDGAPS